MPGFLYPLFLLGAGAAAIPIVLHLLRNEQAPELPFSAVRLLQGVRVEHAQKRRIRDWLLLALRAAALALLAIAFARPYLPGAQVAGSSLAVLTIDRSASMGLGDAWRQAMQAVRAEVDRARPDEALALVTFDDRPDVLVEPTFDRGTIEAALGRVQRGIGGTRYQPALARAASLLDEADARNGRVVLISDLQGTPADARATLPESIRLEIRAVSSGAGNVAVLAARRTPDGVLATLRSDGRGPARVRVRLEDAGRALGEAAVVLPPSQLVEVHLRGASSNRELRVALAEPDPGGLTSDDVRYVEPDAGPRTRVLLVSDPEDRFYVDAALRAADVGSEFDVGTATVQGAVAAFARQPRPQVVFLVGPRGLDRGGRDALVRFVRDGGQLFIAASEALNEPGLASLVEGMSVSVTNADDPVLTVASVEARHPLFQHLGRVADSLGSASFTRSWRVRATGWQVLARFNDGAPALLERRLGAGRVVFFSSDVNRRWNDLPLQTAFVPFLHEIARYLAPERRPTEYTPGTLPDRAQASLGFVTLASGQRVAVNVDPRESDGSRMDAAQFSSAIRHRGERRLDADAARRRAEVSERRQSLWRYGLMLMFGTLVAEGLIGARLTGQRRPWRGVSSPIADRHGRIG
jgi:hypothetical protein